MLAHHKPAPASVIASRQLCRQGIAALEKGRWQDATPLLARAVEACPQDPEPRKCYAEALWREDRHAEALEQLRQAILLSDQDPKLHVMMAEMKLALGRIQGARESAQQALDLDPSLAQAWAVRGRVRQAGGDGWGSLADLQRAVGLDPHNGDVQTRIAELYLRLDRPQQALAAVDQLAENWSAGEEPQYVLELQGRVYLALRRDDEAVESFVAAARRGPLTPALLYQLAEAQLKAGHPRQAESAAREALAMDPRHEPSHALLAELNAARPPPDAVRR